MRDELGLDGDVGGECIKLGPGITLELFVWKYVVCAGGAGLLYVIWVIILDLLLSLVGLWDRYGPLNWLWVPVIWWLGDNYSLLGLYGCICGGKYGWLV